MSCQCDIRIIKNKRPISDAKMPQKYLTGHISDQTNQSNFSSRYWNYGDWSLYWSCSCHCSRLICNLLSSIWWCHIQRRKKITFLKKTKQILKNNNKFLTTFDACNFVRYFWLFLIKSYRCECLSWNIFRRKLFHKNGVIPNYLLSATIQFGFQEPHP